MQHRRCHIQRQWWSPTGQMNRDPGKKKRMGLTTFHSAISQSVKCRLCRVCHWKYWFWSRFPQLFKRCYGLWCATKWVFHPCGSRWDGVRLFSHLCTVADVVACFNARRALSYSCTITQYVNRQCRMLENDTPEGRSRRGFPIKACWTSKYSNMLTVNNGSTVGYRPTATYIIGPVQNISKSQPMSTHCCINNFRKKQSGSCLRPIVSVNRSQSLFETWIMGNVLSGCTQNNSSNK